MQSNTLPPYSYHHQQQQQQIPINYNTNVQYQSSSLDNNPLQAQQQQQQSMFASSNYDTAHTDAIHDIQADYYGKRLASCSSDCTIIIHTIDNTPSSNSNPSTHSSTASPSSSSLRAVATLRGHQAPVWQVAWSHPRWDGGLLASCSFDGKVIIWKESVDLCL